MTLVVETARLTSDSDRSILTYNFTGPVCCKHKHCQRGAILGLKMSENASNPDKFDIKIVHDKFQAALHETDDVDLELYLESFDELSK